MKALCRSARTPFPLLVCTAAATALVSVPMRHWLTESGSIDVPNDRSSHQSPVPRGGGIAGLLGAGFGVLSTQTRPRPNHALGVVALATVGWLDDFTGHVPAKARLLSQLLIGGLVLTEGSPDRFTGALVTSGVVNAANFMDGINGISSLTAITWGVNAMFVDDQSRGDLSTLGALTAGAGLGFLPHNAPTARVFLGDVGSYALGAAMAAGILSQGSLVARYRSGVPLILYGLDTAQALVKRAAAGKRVGEPHRDHVYQQLVDAGFAHSSVALTHAGIAASLSGLAVKTSPSRIAAMVALCVLYMNLPRLANTNSLRARCAKE